MFTWQPVIGFAIKHPDFLRAVPQRRQELLTIHAGRIRANYRVDDIYDTREEAVAVLVRWLQQQWDQAVADLARLSRGDWVRDRHWAWLWADSLRRLRIASAGLRLFAS